jgi:hypothetical protein
MSTTIRIWITTHAHSELRSSDNGLSHGYSTCPQPDTRIHDRGIPKLNLAVYI